MSYEEPNRVRVIEGALDKRLPGEMHREALTILLPQR